MDECDDEGIFSGVSKEEIEHEKMMSDDVENFVRSSSSIDSSSDAWDTTTNERKHLLNLCQ